MTSAWSMSAGGASAESTATRSASPPRAFNSSAAANAGEVTAVVPGHNHAAGVGLADHPPHSIALVAAHSWAQLPNQLAKYHLQSVPVSDMPSRVINGRRPAELGRRPAAYEWQRHTACPPGRRRCRG